MREVRDELTNGQVAAAHQMLVTYDVIAKPGDTTTTYTATVRHIRAQGRREDYKAKLDSDRVADLRRVHGGADTLVLFDIVVPFALLERPIEVDVKPDGTVAAVRGGDAVRDAMREMLPASPRKSPHHQARIRTC